MYAVTGRRGKTLDEQEVFAVQTGFYADDADDGHSTTALSFKYRTHFSAADDAEF